MILFIVDPSSTHDPNHPDQLSPALVEQWTQFPSKTLGILTKQDCYSADEINSARKLLAPLQVSKWIPVSSTSGYGITDAVNQIVEYCENWIHRDQREVLLTRIDHFEAVSKAASHLQRAQKAPEIDLFASDIRHALYSLEPLIGETLPDDILGKIFSDFCIGK